MFIFWLVAGLLIAASLFFLIPPLIQRQKQKDIFERDEINVLLFKDHVTELEADLTNGVLTQDQFEQSKKDLERSLLEDVDSETSQDPKVTDKFGSKAAIVVALFVPILAVTIYNIQGWGEAGLHPENARVNVQAEGHEGSLEDQVRKLQEHLQENPDDVEGWTMLARSYYFLKQYQSASGAFARAVTMTKEGDAQLLADYADALAMASGRSMTGKPYEMIKKALSIQPDHQKALWLAATATYQSKDYKETLQYYQTLIQQFQAGTENYNQMLRNIGEVKNLMGMPIDNEIAQLKASESQQQTASVSGTVTLAQSLMVKAQLEDTLFVYARAASGPKMPLAIVRKQVRDLPLTFTLDDSTAMNPQMKLSKFTDVILSARISKSGNAIPQPGDLQGITSVVKVGASGINIEINNEVSGSGQPAMAPVAATSVQSAPAAGGRPNVAGTVELDSTLKNRVSPDDTVFIFARAAKGPRMPLAVIKLQVKDLPTNFDLDDTHAMRADFAISKFSDVVVGARISKTGNAMPQSGDLKGSSSIIKVGSSNLQIVIDSAVP